MAGLGLQLVNAHKLAQWEDKPTIVVIEGEKKTYVCGQYDIPITGILGKSGFELRWLNWFPKSAALCLALDPDAQEAAWKLGHEIAKMGKRVSVASFPAKPDDMFVNGCTRDEWMAFVHLARRAH